MDRHTQFTEKVSKNNCHIYDTHSSRKDRLCGLVVRVPGYRFKGPGFDSRCQQIFWEVVGLERGSLSLMRTTELLERNRSGSSLENREYGCGDPMRQPHDTLYLHKLALTSPTSGGRSVGIVCLRTKATEFNSSRKIYIYSMFHSGSTDKEWRQQKFNTR
jgi:hypothetical protein